MRLPSSTCSTLAALAVFGLAACGGDSAPPPPSAPAADVSIVLGVGVSTPELSPSMANEPVVTCTVNISAQASGTGLANWLALYFRYYDVRDSTRRLAEFTIDGTDLQGALDGGSIRAGQTHRSTWSITGPYAFAVELQARYQNGSTGTDFRMTPAVRFRCAPSSVDGAGPPSIASYTMTPSSGLLPADSLVTIDVAASTPAGALYSIVRVTGPCVIQQAYVEHFESSVSHSLTLPLPYPCRLGVPLGLDVLTFDATAVGAADGQSYPLTLVDGKPPVLDVAFYPPDAWWTTPLPSGDFVANDTLLVSLGAADNYHVSAIDWEIYPFGFADTLVIRDSAVAADSGLYDGGKFFAKPLLLPLPPEWAGTKLQFRIRARDAEGTWSDELTTPVDSVRITLPPAGASTTDRVAAARGLRRSSNAIRVGAMHGTVAPRATSGWGSVPPGAWTSASWRQSGGFRASRADAGAARSPR